MNDYISYSDESGVGGERYTSIASFSCLLSEKDEIFSTLNAILTESNVSEFKWEKLKDARSRFCAIKIIDYVWDLIGSANARVDVLIWDNQDSRHSVFGRDNTANFGRMFFHLQSKALQRRPKQSTWRLYPDEKVEIDWDTVSSCISSVGQRKQFIEEPLLGSFFTDQNYSISEFKQVKSGIELPCQIADLFAGLSIFSRTHYEVYEKWSEQDTPTLGLWDEVEFNPSNRERYRCEVLHYFNAGCKKHKLGVSLKSYQCLKTPRPTNPINFWHYEPQHENDRAPIK